MVKKQPRRDAWAGVLGEPDTGVGVGYVAWKIAGRECFAGGVLPSAGEGIICTDDTASYARVYQARKGWQTTTQAECRAWTGFRAPRTLLQLSYPTGNLELAYRMPRRGISFSQSWKPRLKIGRQVSPSIDEFKADAGDEGSKLRVVL